MSTTTAHDLPRRSRAPVAPEFWRQIKRTVNGIPVSQQQIDMIVNAVRNGLRLGVGDVVCDIACGNGALSQYLFDHCAALKGSDIDRQLIETANEHFGEPPDFDFVCLDAAAYVATEPEPQRFTKAVCYGSFSYFTADDARLVLESLQRRFYNVQRVFIGNLPDRQRASSFYPFGKDFAAELDRADAPIGIWRSEEDWRDLAADTGWHVSFHQMPGDFYAAHYRFDVILER